MGPAGCPPLQEGMSVMPRPNIEGYRTLVGTWDLGGPDGLTVPAPPLPLPSPAPLTGQLGGQHLLARLTLPWDVSPQAQNGAGGRPQGHQAWAGWGHGGTFSVWGSQSTFISITSHRLLPTSGGGEEPPAVCSSSFRR